MTFNEALSTQLNQNLNSLQREIENNFELSKFILKVMPFTYRQGYAINVMFDRDYKKVKDKGPIISILKTIAQKYNGKLKSLDKDSVIKIFVKESSDEPRPY